MSSRDALITLAWHDVTCPDGVDCRDRLLHAASDVLATSGMFHRFLARLDEFEESGTVWPEKCKQLS